MVQQYVRTLYIPVDQRLFKCCVEVHDALCCIQTYAETGPPLQHSFLILGATTDETESNTITASSFVYLFTIQYCTACIQQNCAQLTL
jgi:hypothetical protein